MSPGRHDRRAGGRPEAVTPPRRCLAMEHNNVLEAMFANSGSPSTSVPKACQLIRMASSDSISGGNEPSNCEGDLPQSCASPETSDSLTLDTPALPDSLFASSASPPESPLAHSRLARRWLAGIALKAGVNDSPSFKDLTLLTTVPKVPELVASPTSILSTPWDQ